MQILAFLLSSFLLCSSLTAAYTVKEGKLVNAETLLLLSPQEHYSLLLEAHAQENWPEVNKQAELISKHFRDSPFYHEALFYSAKACFYQKEYEGACKKLSRYLKKHSSLQHFKEAIELKFLIAEEFRNGAKKHLMGWEALPKWLPAASEALKLYTEVINALPNDDLAAKALYGKGVLEFLEEEFNAAIETFKVLIRRFPKHTLAPDAYVQIGKVYLTQSQEEYPDTDLLDQAQMNLHQFEHSFPQDDRRVILDKTLSEMKNVYAKNFYEIGQFFEKTKKTNASLIYYSKIVKQYPETEYAELSQKRLAALRPQKEREIQAEPLNNRGK